MRERVRRLNPIAEIVEAVRGAVDPDLVLGAVDAGMPVLEDDHGSPAHSHEHEHEHDADAFRAVSLRVPGELRLSAVQAWLGGLMLLRSSDIVRIKGVLAIAGRDLPYVLHGVHDVFDGHDGPPFETTERASRLVLIGHGLEQDALARSFDECRA